MSVDALDLLLKGRYPNPDGGGFLSVPTHSVVIADTLEGIEADVVRQLDLGNRLAVVSDEVTHTVLGARVSRALRSWAQIDEVILPGRPHADINTTQRVRAAVAAADALIAVGSGTINDICKYVAAVDHKPYAVFGTAPSMNGYTSANAAITAHGHKKSLPARVPLGVFLDLRILCRSPSRMIRSGLGDSLCRSTAQCDWLLAHLLLGQPYREAPYALLAADEEFLLAEPGALLRGDPEAMGRLARTLIFSGFGMTVCGSSNPASQGEHLISHYIDMMSDPRRPEFFHGEQVGVATLTVAALQERLLAGPAPLMSPTTTARADLIAHFGPKAGAECWEEFSKKRLDDAAAQRMNENLAVHWDEIRERISAVARPAAALHQVLKQIKAPLSAADIGLNTRFYNDAVHHARELRNRFTFLDLAADSGLLEGAPDA